MELRIGTWNVQALGWGLLQLLLGAACTGDDGNADLKRRAIPQEHDHEHEGPC